MDVECKPVYNLKTAQGMIPGGIKAYIETNRDQDRRFIDLSSAVAAHKISTPQERKKEKVRILDYAYCQLHGKKCLQTRRDSLANLWYLLGLLVIKRAPPMNLLAGGMVKVWSADTGQADEYVACWGAFLSGLIPPSEGPYLTLVRADETGLESIGKFLLASHVLVISHAP